LELRAFVTWAARERAEIFEGSAIDIGANIGNHSLFFADYFRAVHSFEPHPRTFALLRVNAELAANVTCYEFGISDAAREAYISDSTGNAGGATVAETPGSGRRRTEVKTLDAVLDAGERVTLIKLDVEGHEYRALLGCREVIARNCPLILFELHAEEVVDGSSKVIDLLRNFGYESFYAVETVPGLVRFLPPLFAYPVTGLLRVILGASKVVHKLPRFEPKFHPFVIAVPGPS
jgi:FkbM family methyltransferase